MGPGYMFASTGKQPLFFSNSDCSSIFFFFAVILSTTSSYSHKSCETPLSSESSSSVSMAFRNLPPSPSGIVVKEEPCEMATELTETQMTEEDETTEKSIVSHQDGNSLGKKCNGMLILAPSDFFSFLLFFQSCIPTIFSL